MHLVFYQKDFFQQMRKMMTNPLMAGAEVIVADGFGSQNMETSLSRL